MQTDLGADSPSQGPIPDTGEGSTFTKGSLWSAFRQRRWGGGRDLFLCLLILNCLQIKIMLMPKEYILQCHILIPFNIKIRLFLTKRKETE